MARRRGFTLIEVMLGASILTVALVALLGAFFGQSYLNTAARNLTAGMSDATRIMEQIRQQNIGCATPSVLPPAGNSWDEWLNQVDGKSVNRNTSTATERNLAERIAVTCQDETGATYCGDQAGATPAQTGRAEWGRQAGVTTTFNPVRVTAAVGWQQHGRVASGTEFQVTTTQVQRGKLVVQTPGGLIENDTDGDRVIESQAMLTTLVTCR